MFACMRSIVQNLPQLSAASVLWCHSPWCGIPHLQQRLFGYVAGRCSADCQPKAQHAVCQPGAAAHATHGGVQEGGDQGLGPGVCEQRAHHMGRRAAACGAIQEGRVLSKKASLQQGLNVTGNSAVWQAK